MCPTIRGTTLYGDLHREYGYRGSYPSVMRRLRPLLGRTDREPEVRFETDPGHQTQVDWAHLGDHLVGCGMVPLFALVSILRTSRVPSIRFATDRTRSTTLHAVHRLPC